MKKTFLLIAALLMMGSAAFAGGGFDITFGPKVGYQTAKLSYKGADIKNEFSNHFTAGLFGRVTIGRFYVQPEVLYFKSSNLFEMGVTPTDISHSTLNIPTGADVNLTLNSMNLQVPVLLGFNILDLDLVTLRAQVGPTASFTLKSRTLIDYSVNTESGIQNNQSELDPDSDFNTKAIAWGMQAGLGVDVWKFTLDINYNFGLSRVFDSLNNTFLGETFDFSNIDSTKQNMFLVTIGFKLL